MSRPMSKRARRIREEAVLICSIAALREREQATRDRFYDCIARDLPAKGPRPVPPAEWLAQQALFYAWRVIQKQRARQHPFPPPLDDRVLDAEAEALLRTGWTP